MTNEKLIQKRENRRKYHQEWRKRPENKERLRQKDHKRYRENKEKVLKQCKQWKEKNPEKVKEYAKIHRERHPEHQRNWIRKNPIRYWAYGSISMHKQRGYKIEISRTELEDIAKRTLICRYCGCELDYSPLKGKIKNDSPTLDRIDNGNLMTEKTIQIICRRCNMTKHDRTHAEFIGYCEQVARKFKVLT